MSKLKITQVRSPVSRQKDQGRTLRALGLHRMRDTVVHEDCLEIAGMVAKVAHLVEVEEVKG
jgi:large subunit ribosomal protein L30